MRPIFVSLAVVMTAALAQACGSDDPGSSASCAPPLIYVEGSSATYRFERADGTTEDVTATVGATSHKATTFVLESDGGAYSVTDDHGCYDTGNAPARAASDIENDPVARALLGQSTRSRFDEALPSSSSGSEDVPVAPSSPDTSISCETLDGSTEAEPFATRAVIRCSRTARPDPNAQAFTLTTETAAPFTIDDTSGEQTPAPTPVSGLVFKERVRPSGEIDRVRLIEWNGQ